jgi:hypothetical protein
MENVRGDTQIGEAIRQIGFIVYDVFNTSTQIPTMGFFCQTHVQFHQRQSQSFQGV